MKLGNIFTLLLCYFILNIVFGEFWRNSSDEICDKGHSGPGNPDLFRARSFIAKHGVLLVVIITNYVI